MNVADFDFELPESLIAQEPPVTRGASRLMVVGPAGRIEHTHFSNLADYLARGDLLVLNNTQVFPARLLGHRVPSGGAVECLLLEKVSIPNSELPTPNRQPATEDWAALVHPGQRLRVGSRMRFESEGVVVEAEVVAMHFQGRRTVRVRTDHAGGIAAAIDRIGHIPLPPYIKRPDTTADRERYQTVYARARGAIAAPTAGLHFTVDQLDRLAAEGIEQVELTLHVGYGTFKPVTAERIEDHAVDAERVVVSQAACTALTHALREGRRIIAVGTTCVRALESLTIDADGEVLPFSGETGLFIRPGHHFRIVQGMITNFHLPKSSLLMLVCAFAGRERILAAYREAVTEGYRFYSYGDAMMVL